MRQIFATHDQICVANCGVDEIRDHLFVTCDFFGGLWTFIFNWLWFSTTSQGKVLDHLLLFGGLGGFSENVRLTFNIIWFDVVWVICIEQNRRVFHNKAEQLLSNRITL